MYKPIRHKYNAIRCEADGLKFPSKLERDCYLRIKRYQQEGLVRFMIRQVPFDIDYGRHNVDFFVFLEDEALLIEAKGRDLEVGRRKRLSTEKKYGVDIHVVKSVKELDALLKKEPA